MPTSQLSCQFRIRALFILTLGCVVLIAAGCAHMAKPTIGVGGSDEKDRLIGH